MANWYDNPPCRGLWFIFDLDPDITRKVSAADREMMNLAKDICRTCPVKAECLADALQYREQEGIRAGLSPREREAMVPDSVKLWAERQMEVRHARQAEIDARMDRHGMNSPAWRKGCNCAQCSLGGSRENELRIREQRATAKRKVRRAKQEK